MPFASPLLLSALALASVPVIIHLLNRRRFVTVDWAPMQYLRLTLKTNRRRLRLEQLLLLLVRTLLVILLVLAVARPITSQTTVASVLGIRNRAARVIVLDDSLSMGYEADGRTAIERAKAVLQDLLERVSAHDVLTVLTTSNLHEPLFRSGHLLDRADLVQRVADLKVTHTAANWQMTLEKAEHYFEQSTLPARRVTLITDRRRAGWSAGVGTLAAEWAVRDVTLEIIDVGSRRTANVAIVGLEQVDPVALPGVPTRFRASIRNDTDETLLEATATLTVDGRARTLTLPELGPGQRGRLPFTVTFEQAGRPTLHLAVGRDPLVQDNERHLIVNVRPGMDIQLVDGDPAGGTGPIATDPFASETGFLALAYSVGAAPLRVRRVSDAEWLGAPMDGPDLLVLANVSSVPAERVQELERMVRAGMGLMIFPGDQLDAALYNRWMYRDGESLMPARLAEIADEPVTGLMVESVTRSPLEVLTRLKGASLSRIAVRKFQRVQLAAELVDPFGTARVLARWNDRDRSPAVVEKRFGRGRVLLWTVTADKAWSDWPIDSTFVLAIREAAFQMARGGRTDFNLTAGQAIVDPLPRDHVPLEPRVSVPQSVSAESDPAARVERSPDGGHLLRYEGTTWAGIYSLHWKNTAAPSGPKAWTHLFAVNPAANESDLTVIESETIREWVGDLDIRIVSDDRIHQALAGGIHELWRQFAWMLLLIAMVETFLAAWVGRTK